MDLKGARVSDRVVDRRKHPQIDEERFKDWMQFYDEKGQYYADRVNKMNPLDVLFGDTAGEYNNVTATMRDIVEPMRGTSEYMVADEISDYEGVIVKMVQNALGVTEEEAKRIIGVVGVGNIAKEFDAGF